MHIEKVHDGRNFLGGANPGHSSVNNRANERNVCHDRVAQQDTIVHPKPLPKCSRYFPVRIKERLKQSVTGIGNERSHCNKGAQ